MFLKEKRDRTIKARRCADSQSQCEYTTKTETSSPTVSHEAMMISCAIEAKKGQYMVATNIPGAFLYAEMETDLHTLIEGTISELIIKLVPSLYRKYIWKTKMSNKWHTSSSERHYSAHFKWP